MLRSLWTSATGMIAQQMDIDVVANNLANVNTLGFKKSTAEFEDLIYQTMRIAGSQTPDGGTVPTGMQVGMGVRPASVHRIFTQGDFQNTGNPLDLAIEGDGFFQVLVNGELAYTRAGSFKVDDEGTIVNAHGYVLQPEFSVPDTTVNIVVDETGTIEALDSNGDVLATADIPLHTFVNPAGLKSLGRNLFVDTEASGPATEGTPGEDNVGTIAQGFLEMSNVELVEEMVEMIIGQRAFEANSKGIRTSDTMMQVANQLVR